MEGFQIPRGKRRTDEEYLSILKEFAAYSQLIGEVITFVNFERWSIAKFGINLGSGLIKAFQKGRKTSFNELKAMIGLPYIKINYTREELLIFLDEVYNNTGKIQPTLKDWNSYRNSLSEGEKIKMPHSRTIENVFKRWTNAWEFYYFNYEITTTDLTISRTPRGRKQGLKIEYLKNYNMERSPVTEQGVVYLFAKLDVELGFTDVYIQEAFPDCIAVYSNYEDKIPRKVNIEFKYSLAKLFAHLRKDFILNRESRWSNIHCVIYWVSDLHFQLADRYKLLEDEFGTRAINLKRHFLTMKFIPLKEMLDKKHQS